MGKYRQKGFTRSNLSYLQVSILDSKRAKIIIEKATNHYPNDPSLWNKRLSLLIENSNDSQTIKNEFRLACQNSAVKVNNLFIHKTFLTMIDLEFSHGLEYDD